MEQDPGQVPHGAPEEEDDDYGERWMDLLGYVHELRSEPCDELPEEPDESAC